MPYQYLDEYLELLFINKDERKIVKKTTIFVANDTFYTLANLLHNPKNVALATILVSAKISKVEFPGSENYNLDDFKDRVKEKQRSEIDKTKYWFKMIDTEIELMNVNSIITMIFDFYSQIKK